MWIVLVLARLLPFFHGSFPLDDWVTYPPSPRSCISCFFWFFLSRETPASWTLGSLILRQLLLRQLASSSFFQVRPCGLWEIRFCGSRMGYLSGFPPFHLSNSLKALILNLISSIRLPQERRWTSTREVILFKNMRGNSPISRFSISARLDAGKADFPRRLDAPTSRLWKLSPFPKVVHMDLTIWRRRVFASLCLNLLPIAGHPVIFPASNIHISSQFFW